jgi:hypothetical protein
MTEEEEGCTVHIAMGSSSSDHLYGENKFSSTTASPGEIEKKEGSTGGDFKRVLNSGTLVMICCYGYRDVGMGEAKLKPSKAQVNPTKRRKTEISFLLDIYSTIFSFSISPFRNSPERYLGNSRARN